MGLGRDMLRQMLYVRGNMREIRFGRGSERSSWEIAGG